MPDSFIVSRRRFLTLSGAVALIPLIGSPTAIAAAPVEDLINRLRRENGAGYLQIDQVLEQAALYQAKLMAKHGKIGHSIGWGNGFTARLRQAGIRGAAAENVASGQKDEAAALDAWMKSAGHRRNFIDPVFTRYGLAYAVRADKPHYRYWAMLFGA